jgi:hypothetical protein
MCVGYPGGTKSRLTVVGGMVLEHYGPVLTSYNNALVFYYKHVENQNSVYKLSTNYSYFVSHKTSVHPSNLFKFRFNIILPSTPRSSMPFLSFNQNTIWISFMLHACHMSRDSHPTLN